MSTITSRLLATALGCLLGVVGGCTTDSTGIIVYHIQAIGGETCSVTGNLDDPFQGSGTLDYVNSSGYLLTPVLQSSISLEDGATQDQRLFTLQGIDVQVRPTTDPTSVQLVNALSVANLATRTFRAAGTLAPGGTLGFGVNGLDLPQVEAIDEFFAGSGGTTTIILRFRAFGQMVGGSRAESLWFEYPVELCGGCSAVVVGMCPLDEPPVLANPCNIFQDGVTECCREPITSVRVCPGRSSSN